MKIHLENQKKQSINAGDIIITKCKSEEVKRCLVIENRNGDIEDDDYLLVDLEFSELRCFIPNDMIEDFIENNLEEEVLETILSDEIVISRWN